MNTRIKYTLVGVMIVLFPPIGIILMWWKTTWDRAVKWAVTGMCCFIAVLLILNRLVSYDHPIQYFARPNLTSAVFSLTFLLVPAVAVTIAVAMRRTYWIVAVVIALLSVPINVYLFFDQYTCKGEFCGLGDALGSIIIPTILGILAIIVSAIKLHSRGRDG